MHYKAGVRTRPIGKVVVLLFAIWAAACGQKTARVAPPRQTTIPPPPAPSAAPSSSVPQPKPESGAKPAPPPAPRPAEPVAPAVIPPAPVPSPVPASPPVRIGLNTTAKEVRISGGSGYYILEKKAEAARQLVAGEVRVRVEQEVDESSEIYRIQVGSFAKAETAEALRSEIERTLNIDVVIQQNSQGLRQVRVGEFATREEAMKYASADLALAGYRNFMVVRETKASGGGEARLALRGPENLFRINRTGFLFFPGSAGEPLQLDGKPYRGILDLTLNSATRITSVNQLGMEEYLLGVVPAEISPTTYPEFAALAAQSVAARTYALKNIGRFRAEGFDLTADVRSQVYFGLSGENEAASEAVRQTFGMAVYYDGKLIDAMYSSTCGGRTEDFGKVFDAPEVPYLKSVVCAVELGPDGAPQTELSARRAWSEPVFADDGTLANRNLEIAQVLGLGVTPDSSAYYLSPSAPSELTQWVGRALSFSQKASAGGPVAAKDLGTRAGFLQYAVESFFGAEEIRRRISAADTEYYVGNLGDAKAVPAAARPSLAYLMHTGLWHPFPDNTARPREAIRRGDALSLLVRWILSSQPDLLRTGVFIGPGASLNGNTDAATAISVKSGRQTLQLPLSEEIRLYRIADNRSIPVDHLYVLGNEKLSYHLGQSGKIDFLEIELSPSGAASDRFSPVAVWQTTLTRQILAEKLRPLAPSVGEVRDLKVFKTGESGRAVQIQVIGSRGSTVLNGYRVRNALGLRDTLFNIERAKGAEGLIESFTFRGRGWGHGVGLCQVGAYGMARSGRSYEEILKTYYTGVELKKAY
jgi:stage II sporulation protein D